MSNHTSAVVREMRRHHDGEIRFNPERPWVMEEFTTRNRDGGGSWTALKSSGVYVGGRIVARAILATADQKAIEAGAMNVKRTFGGERPVAEVVTVQIMTATSPDGADLRSYYVTGPSTILDLTPGQWKKAGASIPDELQFHRGWPAYASTHRGAKFSRAIAVGGYNATKPHVRFQQMGWVPDGTGWCAFLAGDQRTVRDEESAVVPGITGDRHPSTAGIGMIVTSQNETSHDRTRQAAADMESVFEAYADEGLWTDPAYGALAIAAMLRPTLPLQTSTTIVVHGTTATGKSEWAAFAMSGWQARGGTWTARHLPSAGGTGRSLGYAIGQTPIFVSDDHRNDKGDDDLRLIVDAVHSNDSSHGWVGPGGERRRTPESTALLIVTAEQTFGGAYVARRAVNVPFSRGLLTTDEARFCRALTVRDADEPAAARLVGAVTRLWIDDAETPTRILGSTWTDHVATAKHMLRKETEGAGAWLASLGEYEPWRCRLLAEKIAEITVAFAPLGVACPSGIVPVALADKLSWFNPDSYRQGIGRLVMDGERGFDLGGEL